VTLSPDQIQKLATLAKLKISDEAMDEMSSQLDNIMNLIDHMERADTNGVEPLSHPQDPILRLREDEVTQPDMRDAFMKLTSHDQDGLYTVPKVIE
jgi:aspartyl-tRNA(Asn)/glutamyl-tRNA(Gln) amidotransferase subunit C